MAKHPEQKVTPWAALIGKTLAILRGIRGVTQATVAERTGFNPTYISLVETGRRDLSLEGLDKFASALGVPTWAVLMWATCEEPVATAWSTIAKRVSEEAWKLVRIPCPATQ